MGQQVLVDRLQRDIGRWIGPRTGRLNQVSGASLATKT